MVFFKCAVIKFIKVQKKFSFKKKYHTNPSFPFVLTKFHVNFECPPYFLEWHKGQKITQKKADNKEWQIIFHISFIWPIPIWRNFMLIWTEYHAFGNETKAKKMTQKKAKWQQRTNHFGLSLSYNNFSPRFSTTCNYSRTL